MLIRLPATRRSAAMAHCRRWYRARSCRRLRLGAPARASAGTAAAPVEPAQGRRPGAREALDRLLAASAVDVLVGNLPHPPPEMRFQRRPADERVTGDRIAFDVTDAALVFSLGARSVWSTGPRPEIPVMRKGGEPLVGADLARRRVVAVDQRGHCRTTPRVSSRQSGGTLPRCRRTMPTADHGGAPAQTLAAS